MEMTQLDKKIIIMFAERKEEINPDELKWLILERVKRILAGLQRIKNLEIDERETRDDKITLSKWVRNNHYTVELRMSGVQISSFSLSHNDYSEGNIIKEFLLGTFREKDNLGFGFIINDNIIVKVYHPEFAKYFETKKIENKNDVSEIMNIVKNMIKDFSKFTEKIVDLPVVIQDN